ncbi:MAG: hypothetical protein RLZZ494_127, partial [Pseudomonadota bacterium]
MTAAAVPDHAPPPPVGSSELARSLARAQRRRHAAAIALTLPLLVFLIVTFLVPIGALLIRAVENPEVADALPRTAQALAHWDHKTLPAEAAFAAVVDDLAAMDDGSQAGALARRLNTEQPGSRSLVMATYRALPDLRGEAGSAPPNPAALKDKLLALDARWGELPYWQAIGKNASRWTPDYLLTSIDLKRSADGGITQVAPEQRVFSSILLRTFVISAVVTFWCLLLGYPLAYWLST